MNKIFLLPTILLLGCNAGLELTVKPPIHQACESSKLKGCDEITSGVLTFIEGDKVNGTTPVQLARNYPVAPGTVVHVGHVRTYSLGHVGTG